MNQLKGYESSKVEIIEDRKEYKHLLKRDGRK